MCEYCAGINKHEPGCPYYEPVVKCSKCGGEAGEGYYTINDVVICEHCLEDMYVEEIMKLFNVEREEIYA